ncbi:MAG: hypothetical protein KAH21_08000, partial [Spirochaetaceae bacterium]|nr:hypothetical protein [Spirochaetaceae bacterium]
MPIAAVFTLISLGVFVLASIYSIALSLFSHTRLYFILIVFSLACIAFSAIQTIHLLNSDNSFQCLGVQISYIFIVLLNPVLLIVLLKPQGKLRIFLLGLFFFNSASVLVIIMTAVLQPALLISSYVDGAMRVGPVQYVRAV